MRGERREERGERREGRGERREEGGARRGGALLPPLAPPLSVSNVFDGKINFLKENLK